MQNKIKFIYKTCPRILRDIQSLKKHLDTIFRMKDRHFVITFQGTVYDFVHPSTKLEQKKFDRLCKKLIAKWVHQMVFRCVVDKDPQWESIFENAILVSSGFKEGEHQISVAEKEELLKEADANYQAAKGNKRSLNYDSYYIKNETEVNDV